MKRYGLVFAMFGFVVMILVALATDMEIGTAMKRGLFAAIGFGILGAAMGKVVHLQLEEINVEEQERTSLAAATEVIPDDVYGRFRNLVISMAGEAGEPTTEDSTDTEESEVDNGEETVPGEDARTRLTREIREKRAEIDTSPLDALNADIEEGLTEEKEDGSSAATAEDSESAAGDDVVAADTEVNENERRLTPVGE